MCKPYLLCICCSSLVSTTTQSFSRKKKTRTLTQLLRSRTQLSGFSLFLCENSCFLWCPNDWKIREMIVNALLHTLLMNNVPSPAIHNNPREKIAHHQRIHSEKNSHKKTNELSSWKFSLCASVCHLADLRTARDLFWYFLTLYKSEQKRSYTHIPRYSASKTWQNMDFSFFVLKDFCVIFFTFVKKSDSAFKSVNDCSQTEIVSL